MFRRMAASIRHSLAPATCYSASSRTCKHSVAPAAAAVGSQLLPPAPASSYGSGSGSGVPLPVVPAARASSYGSGAHFLSCPRLTAAPRDLLLSLAPSSC
ncbi:hypothetical protein Zm00014a_031507 [Zea mays]|uniref:Uncharacterized protein n=4 Tax=Zea mays TaxID=4577 RepID=A0A8J8XT14_MAIZE|nr:hypothetical protein ZEAMMB73_Zm00001d044941 [Zea mays]PWZ58596.1 hypothetical protein Zm00014a_031507 [Zea mays]